MYGITTLLYKNINTFAHTHLIIKIPNQMHYMPWVYPCCALILGAHSCNCDLLPPSCLQEQAQLANATSPALAFARTSTQVLVPANATSLTLAFARTSARELILANVTSPMPGFAFADLLGTHSCKLVLTIARMTVRSLTLANMSTLWHVFLSVMHETCNYLVQLKLINLNIVCQQRPVITGFCPVREFFRRGLTGN